MHSGRSLQPDYDQRSLFFPDLEGLGAEFSDATFAASQDVHPFHGQLDPRIAVTRWK